jgi:hypothetical protein
MAEIEIDPKHKGWAIAVGVLLLVVALLDMVALKGDWVGSGRVDLRSDSEPLVVAVTRPSEKHTVEMTTKRRLKGEMRGKSVAYRLVDPNGTEVLDESEMITRKKRFFSFYPSMSGDYLLYAEEAKLLGSSRGSAQVEVTVNDRRVLSRWLGL